MESLLPSLLLIPEVDVVAVCDRDPERVDIAAKLAYRAPRYLNWREALKRTSPDAVVAACPPQIHYQVAKAALNQNIHVFVEKPPTLDLGQLEELSALSILHGRVTGVGHNMRYAEQFQALRREVLHKDFGRPMAMDVRYACSGPRGPRWGLKSSLRGLLLSHAIHALDLLIMLMGPVVKVTASITKGDDHALTLFAALKFRHGAAGGLMLTTGAPWFSLEATISSSKNRIVRMDSLRDLTLLGYPNDRRYESRRVSSRTLTRGYSFAGYQDELAAFISAIKGSSCMGPSFRDEVWTYKAMALLEESLASTR